MNDYELKQIALELLIGIAKDSLRKASNGLFDKRSGTKTFKFSATVTEHSKCEVPSLRGFSPTTTTFDKVEKSEGLIENLLEGNGDHFRSETVEIKNVTKYDACVSAAGTGYLGNVTIENTLYRNGEEKDYTKTDIKLDDFSMFEDKEDEGEE